jgi:1-acyl-sn-glycerol-3-phosphate acyltransferase
VPTSSSTSQTQISEKTRSTPRKSVGAFLRACVFWFAVAGTTPLFGGLVCLLFPIVAPFDKNRHSLHAIAIFWAKTIVALNPWWKFHVKGGENFPPLDKPVVFVANHNSQTDILAIYLLGRRFRWLSKESVFRVPFMGWAMKLIGYVGVRRGDKESQLKCMEESGVHLKNGVSIVFFPEGTRSRNGTLGVFKSGAFRLAKEANVDVVPLTLIGTAFPHVTDVTIVVHPVLPSANHTMDSLLVRAREVVASALPEHLRG